MNPPIVVTATPTLFTDTLQLNIEEIHKHLLWLKTSGVDAIFAAGTTGEFTTLTDGERLEILDLSLDVFGADRTYFHVGAPSAMQAAAIAREARLRGAHLLAAVTPYYQSAPEEEVLRYYERVVSAADGASVFAYLFAARTTTVSVPSLLPKLAAVGVGGVKISGESDESVADYLQNRPGGFTIFSGNDISFEWFSSSGGDGIVSGVSSVYPEPFVKLRDSLKAGSTDDIRQAQVQIERAVAAVNAGSLTHLKAGINARGFAGGAVRSAVAAVPEDHRRTIVELASEFANNSLGEPK